MQKDVRAQQTRLLRGLLWGMLVVLALTTALSPLVFGRETLTLEGLALNLILGGVILLGLWLLTLGRFKTTIWFVSGVVLLYAVYRLAEVGIVGHGAGLLIFVAPVTLVGLLLGRRALFLIAGLSIAAVLTVLGLELTGSPAVGRTVEEQQPAVAVVIFLVITALLVVFLDRFALTLRDALATSVAREARLQEEVSERERVETRLRLATGAAHIGVWSWNLETNEVEWSDTMYEIFDVAPGTPTTLDTFMDRVHPEDRDTMQQSTSNLEGGGDSPYRIVLTDGRVRWLVGRGEVVSGQDGTQRMIGAVYDVTPIKEGEEAREQLFSREQEARRDAESAGSRLAFLAEASHILAESLDYKETLTQVANLSVPELADWCAIDVLNDQGLLERVTVAHTDPEKVRFAEELQERYPPDPNEATGAYAVLRSGEPDFYPNIPDELLVTVAQDEEHLEMLRQVGFSSAIVVPLKSRERTLGVLTLVTAESGEHFDADSLELATQLAQRAAIAVDNARLYGEAQALNAELEGRVKARTAELEEANRELEAFTYSASHDLRAPLRGINGFSQALLEDYAESLDDTAKEYLTRIYTGATRMGEIIEDLLKLSRISRSAPDAEEVDLSALARSITDALREAEPARQVKVQVAENLSVRGDARLLRIALENLLGNAWKFTAARENACIEVGWSEAQAAFFVKDNGAGFDMAFADKLFLPFQRLHSPGEYEGSGIGLATTQRIVERHGGRIWAEAAEGEGATFYFTLQSSTVAEAATGANE